MRHRENIPARNQIMHEGAIDLDGVERIVPQKSQRGGPSAEVVHGQPNPEAAQLAHQFETRLRITHDLPLRDFELQTPGWQSDTPERGARLFKEQAAQRQLGPRDIDADGLRRALWIRA